MSEIQSESIDALLALVDMAQLEIAEALDGSEELPESFVGLCRDHVETIGWAADMAGLVTLKLVADAVQAWLETEGLSLDESQAVGFGNWMSDLQLHVANPDDPELQTLLLAVLPEAEAAETRARLEAGRVENPSEPEPGEIPAQAEVTEQETAVPKVTLDAITLEGDDPGFESEGMLGMLAAELHEARTELGELASQIAGAEKAKILAASIDAYRELVNRILMVAEELKLEGLIQVCRFVLGNVEMLAEQSPAERAVATEVLQEWPDVVIEHLLMPDDDARCIAVVDFLERETWPNPLPYREVRGLIEGLIAELEVSGDQLVEKREVDAEPEDVALEMSADVSPELVEAFFAESPGHAENLSRLVEAIARGDDIQKNVESAQRIAHTLKGSGNLVGARGISTLSHHVEDIFEYIARQKMTPPTALADTMQEAADTIEAMLEFMQGVGPEPENGLEVLQKVLDWANRIDTGEIRREDFAADSPALRHREDDATATMPEDFVDRRQPPAEKRETATEGANPTSIAETVRVPLDVLDNMFRVVSETAIAIGQIQEHLNRLEESDRTIRKNDSSLQQRRYELENLVSIRGMAARHRVAAIEEGGDFDPLEMDTYDEFYGATHAYIEGVADSRLMLREFTSEVSELNALFLLQQRLNKELQEVIMTTRMVPVGTISARLQRAVRQACRATGKQAELLISGEDLLLDGDVLNRLADPLMHMLRNAVDHGIEALQQRLEADKPEVGEIRLTFRQEGNSVVVDCADDGAGLDYDRIRATAIRRGLITEGDVVGNAALARMILHSGFSTSERVTQVSGRGVGMDVVNNTIQSLKGSMDIGDGEACGTLMSLRLPITLLTSHCLLVSTGQDETYAIPTTALTQILSPGTGQLGRVGNQHTYQLDKEVYTAHTLDGLLGRPESAASADLSDSSVLLVQTGDGVKAVTVGKVISSYDLVLKGMGAYVKSLRGVAGVSILGNGSVVTVLDLPSLLESRDQRSLSADSSQPAREGTTDAPDLPKVLIVDDSLSVRSSLSQLMSDGGYQVATARDGLEAVNMLEAEAPDIVLTDLEMPRMNGLDLVGYIRNSSQWNPLPVVMITSRTMAKHRQQAEQAGVNRYITKPFTEDEVLAEIDQQLALPLGERG